MYNNNVHERVACKVPNNGAVSFKFAHSELDRGN